MEMAYELDCNMFKVAFICSLVSVGRHDVLAPNIPFKEGDTWIEKAEAMELKYTNLQKYLITIRKEVEAANYLQDEVKVYNSLSTLMAHVSKHEGSLWDVEK